MKPAELESGRKRSAEHRCGSLRAPGFGWPRRGVPWKIFHDINIVNLAYKPCNAAGWPLTDCGLLGPVTLTPAAE